MYYVLDQKKLRSLPQISGPSVNFSSLNKLDLPIPVRGFSIKFVIEGMERYIVNGHDHAVTAGQFLLLNNKSRNRAVIDSDRMVKGVCIELTTAIMDQAVASLLADLPDPIEGESFFTSDRFIEQIHHANSTSLGNILGPLAIELASRPEEDRKFHVNLYHSMAEAVINDHRELLLRSGSVPAIKSETRKDLFRRVQKAKRLIHERYAGQLDIGELSREACMSEFHFYRVFKAWTGMSPYAYLLHVRLQHAKALLEKGDRDITEVALACGFTSIHNFSRSFKKWCGTPPSKVFQRSSRN